MSTRRTGAETGTWTDTSTGAHAAARAETRTTGVHAATCVHASPCSGASASADAISSSTAANSLGSRGAPAGTARHTNPGACAHLVSTSSVPSSACSVAGPASYWSESTRAAIGAGGCPARVRPTCGCRGDSTGERWAVRTWVRASRDRTWGRSHRICAWRCQHCRRSLRRRSTCRNGIKHVWRGPPHVLQNL